MSQPNDQTPKPDETPAGDEPVDKKDGTSKTQTPPADDPAAKTFTKAEVDRMIAKATKEAERKAADAEAKAKLDETERLAAELKEMKAEVQLRDARDAITDALKEAGARNPKLLFAAVRDQLEFDEAGKLKDLAGMVKDLSDTYPEQFGKGETPGKVDAGAGNEDKAKGLTQAELEKMTPQEIARLPWDDVKAALVATP